MNLVFLFYLFIKVNRESYYFPRVVWLPPVWQHSVIFSAITTEMNKSHLKKKKI